MKVSIIAAIGKNREIGKNNDLLWHLPADMNYFKEKTLGHHVIMGRKNYESIPPKYRPLIDRTNVVISRDPEYNAPECFVETSIEDALKIADEFGDDETFVIGGSQIYAMALDAGVVHTMYLTHVNGAFPDADTFFPAFDENKWNKELIFEYISDVSNAYSFSIYEYTNKELVPTVKPDADDIKEAGIE